MSAINQDRTLALVYENTNKILSIIQSNGKPEVKSANENNNDK